MFNNKKRDKNPTARPLVKVVAKTAVTQRYSTAALALRQQTAGGDDCPNYREDGGQQDRGEIPLRCRDQGVGKLLVVSAVDDQVTTKRGSDVGCYGGGGGRTNNAGEHDQKGFADNREEQSCFPRLVLCDSGAQSLVDLLNNALLQQKRWGRTLLRGPMHGQVQLLDSVSCARAGTGSSGNSNKIGM